MINLTHMVSILNSVFIVMFYMMRRPNLDPTCICFKEFLNQLNLLYIYICLYLQWKKDIRVTRSNELLKSCSITWGYQLVKDVIQAISDEQKISPITKNDIANS
jgi:hypothetical protein